MIADAVVSAAIEPETITSWRFAIAVAIPRFCSMISRPSPSDTSFLKLVPHGPNVQRQAAGGADNKQREEQTEDQMKNLEDRVSHRHGKTEERLPFRSERRRCGIGA